MISSHQWAALLFILTRLHKHTHAILLFQTLTGAASLDLSTTESSPQQMHCFLFVSEQLCQDTSESCVCKDIWTLSTEVCALWFHLCLLHTHLIPVFAPGGMVGQRLSDHPDIRKLGFTGSTPIGKQIMKRYGIRRTHGPCCRDNHPTTSNTL